MDEETDSAIVKTGQPDHHRCFPGKRLGYPCGTNGQDRPHDDPFPPRRRLLQVPGDPSSHRAALVSRLKIMAQLDISKNANPRTARSGFKLRTGTSLNFVSRPSDIGPVNEDVVMRILAASKPLPLDKIGMSPENLKSVYRSNAKNLTAWCCVWARPVR